MDLWIRSQDKRRLMKVENIYMVHDDDNFCDYIGDSMVGHLGKYTKVGRALEVLDEIQNILKSKYMVRMDGNLNNVENFLNIKGAYIKNEDNADVKNINGTYVYEMPEK